MYTIGSGQEQTGIRQVLLKSEPMAVKKDVMSLNSRMSQRRKIELNKTMRNVKNRMQQNKDVNFAKYPIPTRNVSRLTIRYTGCAGWRFFSVLVSFPSFEKFSGFSVLPLATARR